MNENEYGYEYAINPGDLIALQVATEMLIAKLDQQIKDSELSSNSYFCKYKAELEQVLNKTHFSNLKHINWKS